jgi:hypothetical protein
MGRMSVLRMSQQSVRTQVNKSQLTLSADDYADSGVAKLPGHRHQRIDERSSFSEVLLGERHQ